MADFTAGLPAADYEGCDMMRLPMHRSWLLLAVLLAAGLPAVAGVEDGPRHIDHPAWMSPGLVDLQTDLETVRAQGKTGVMVLFTTQGCTYCAEFVRASLGDPATEKRVRDNFIAIGLEIFDDAEMTGPLGDDLPIKVFAERQKAGMAPTLLFFGTDGKLIYRAIGYQDPERFNRMLDYLVDGRHERQSFRDYLAGLAPAKVEAAAVGGVLQSDPLFENPPYALSRQDFPASEPLLVIFEAPACGDCTAYHRDVLALDEVRQLLQQFEVVRLDASDAHTPVIGPDGEATTPARWYAREGFSRLPALLYADESGKTVFKTDALVERQRMLNATGLVLERAYEKGWSYQRFARSKAIQRSLSKN